MENTKTAKAGWLYLVIIELFIVMNIFMTMFMSDKDINIFLNVLLTDGLIAIPMVVYLISTGSHIKETFRFRRVRISTLLLSIIYTLMWYPLIAACNALTMLVTENAVMSMSDQFLGYPFLVSWLVIAAAGPFFEELTFRGAILSGFRQSGRIFAAILLQGLLFGLLHLNLNQMAYATVLGIAFGLLVEATGSIWTSFLGHMCINTIGTAATYMLTSMQDEMGLAEIQDTMGGSGMSRMILIMAAFMLAAGCVSVLLAMLLLRAMAANEGRGDALRAIFEKRRSDDGQKLMSLPVILAIVLACVFIIIRTFIL